MRKLVADGRMRSPELFPLGNFSLQTEIEREQTRLWAQSRKWRDVAQNPTSTNMLVRSFSVHLAVVESIKITQKVQPQS